MVTAKAPVLVRVADVRVECGASAGGAGSPAIVLRSGFRLDAGVTPGAGVRDGRDVRNVDDWNVDGRKHVENELQVLSTV